MGIRREQPDAFQDAVLRTLQDIRAYEKERGADLSAFSDVFESRRQPDPRKLLTAALSSLEREMHVFNDLPLDAVHDMIRSFRNQGPHADRPSSRPATHRHIRDLIIPLETSVKRAESHEPGWALLATLRVHLRALDWLLFHDEEIPAWLLEEEWQALLRAIKNTTVRLARRQSALAEQHQALFMVTEFLAQLLTPATPSKLQDAITVLRHLRPVICPHLESMRHRPHGKGLVEIAQIVIQGLIANAAIKDSSIGFVVTAARYIDKKGIADYCAAYA